MGQIIINILLSASLILIVAFFYELLYFVTKFFNLAHAVVLVLGPYFTIFFSKSIGLNVVVSITLAIMSSVSLSLLLEILIFRYMRRKKVPPINYFIVSLSILIVVQNTVSLIFGDGPKELFKIDLIIGENIFDGYVTKIQLISFAIFSALYIAGILLLKFTRLGKSIRAVANNPELSNIYGINSNRIVLYTFAIASFIASGAGILASLDTSVTPSFGFTLLIYGVAAMIISGLGNTSYLIFGAFLIAMVQNLTAYYVNTEWMDAGTYLILIIFLLFRPMGISGVKLKKINI